MVVNINVNTIITVDTAFTSGVTPIFNIEYIAKGKVFEPGPAVKNVIIKSSIDKVNAINPPATIPGKIVGNKTNQNVLNGLAPKSLAASKMLSSIPCILVLTAIATKLIQNAEWAKIIDDKPNVKLINIKNSNNDTPTNNSGAATGTIIKEESTGTLCLCSDTPANVPNTTEIRLDKNAINNELIAAWINSLSANNTLYHFKVKPTQLTFTRESLNENSITTIKGIYKNKNPNIPQISIPFDILFVCIF